MIGKAASQSSLKLFPSYGFLVVSTYSVLTFSERLSCTYVTAIMVPGPVPFPIQPFRTGAGSPQAERRQSQRALEVVRRTSAESLGKVAREVVATAGHLSAPCCFHLGDPPPPPRLPEVSRFSSAPEPLFQALCGWGRRVQGLEK